MAILTPREGRAYLAPLVAFLLFFLGFPAVVEPDLFRLGRSPSRRCAAPIFSGFGNYLDVLRRSEFWRRRAVLGPFRRRHRAGECRLGLFLAIFLAPLLPSGRSG